MVDADSLPELLEPGRLGPLVPLPGRRQPHSNVIHPVVELQEPHATFPGPEDGGNVWKKEEEGRDDDADGGGAVLPVDGDKDTGYSSGPDDEDDDDN